MTISVQFQDEVLRVWCVELLQCTMLAAMYYAGLVIGVS